MTELLLLVGFLILSVYSGRRILIAKRNGTLYAELDTRRMTVLSRYLEILRLDVKPLLLVLAIVMFGIAAFFLFLEIFPGRQLGALAVALGLTVFSFVLLKDFAVRRSRAFEAHLVDSIDLMRAALKSGENPRQALITAARSSRNDVGVALTQAIQQLELGLSIEQAFRRIRVLYPSPSVALFVNVLIAKWEGGADLSLLLDSINRILRDQLRLASKIRSELSGTRYALIFIGLMPYSIIGMFLWLQPDWLDALINHEWGARFFISAIALQFIGYFWMRRILRSDYS